MDLVCCTTTIDTKAKLIGHLNSDHFEGNKLKNESEPWLCFVIGCSSEIRVKKGVRKHLERKHSKIFSKIYCDDSSDSSSDESSDETGAEQVVDNQICDLNDCNSDIDSIAQSLNNCVLNNDQIDQVVGECTCFSDDSNSNLNQLFKLRSTNTSSDKAFLNTVNGITRHLVSKFEKNEFLAAAEEIIDSTESIYSFRRALKEDGLLFDYETVKVPVDDSTNVEIYHYSLANILKTYLKNEFYLKKILEDHFDGPNRESRTVELKLDYFCDDYNPVDKNPDHKLSIIFLALANIPLKYQCTNDEIQLFQIAQRKDYDLLIKNGKKIEFHRPFIDQFNNINNDPLVLNTALGQFKFTVKLENVCGDNLALNELKCITKSFISNCCKWCNMKHSEMQMVPPNFDFPPRTDHDEHCLKECMLDGQDEIYLYCCDPFHDISHGAVSYFNKYLIHKYYANNVKFLKQAQSKFTLEHGRINFTANSYSATGSQQLEFFIMFALYDTRVDRNSNDFKFYEIFRNVIAYVNADDSDKFSTQEIDMFQSLVKEFYSYYMTHILDPSNDDVKTAKPKFHHLLHYHEFLRNKKNLRRLNCKRFERKIQQLKRLVSPSNSVINLAKQTISKYSQNHKETNLKNFCDEADNFIEKKFSCIDTKYSKFLNANERIFSMPKDNKFVFEKMVLKEGVVFMINNQMPLEFIEIKKIYRQNGKYTLVGKKFLSNSFNRFYCAYEIQRTEELIQINPGQITNHKSIQFQKIGPLELLPLSFYAI